MRDLPDQPPPTVWPRRVRLAAGVYALAAGMVTLTGWAMNVERLADWNADGITVFPNTAVAAMLCGAALLLLGKRGTRAAGALGLLAGLIGAATLFEHIARIDLGIDTLLFPRDFSNRAAASPMRMGVPASLSFTVLGAVLALAGAGDGPRVGTRRFIWVGGLVVCAVAALSLIGYMYGADNFYAIPNLTGIAMPTSTILLALGLGLVAAVPEHGPMRRLAEDSAASGLLRRALPIVVLLPIGLGWLRIRGQQAGLYDLAFGTALRTIVELGLLAGLLWWSAAAVRRHEGRLTDARDRQEGILRTISDLFQALDSQWRFTYLNTAMRRGLAEQGIDPDAALGRSIFEVLPEFSATEGAAHLRRAMAERVDVAYEINYEPWGRWFAVRGSPTPDGGLSVLALDISAAKVATEQTRRAAELLTRIVDRSPSGFYIVDAGFCISHMNADSQARAFRNVNPAVGRRLDDALRVLWPEPVATELIAIFQHTLDTGEPYVSPGLVSRRADLGTLETYEWQLERITMPDGAFAVVCYFYDTTPLREAERAVRETRIQLESALAGGAVGTWNWDLATNILTANHRLLEIFGLDPGYADSGLPPEAFLSALAVEDRPSVEAAIAKSLAPGSDGVYHAEYRVTPAPGEVRWVLARGQVEFDAAGRPVRMPGALTNITERKLAEEALRENEHRLAAELAAAESLQAVSTRLIQSGDVADLYETIMDAAVAIMGSRFASMQILEASPDKSKASTVEENVLRLVAFRGFNADAARSWEYVRPASNITRGIALSMRERTIVPDVRACARTAGGDLKTYLGTGILAVQTTPLLSRSGELLGMISTHWSEPHTPGAAALRSLDVLARQAADLIERTRHQNELRALVEARTAELELSHADLRRAERLATMGTLTAGLGHDLSNLMLPLRMRLDVLAGMETRPEVLEEIAGVRKGLSYLQQLVSGLRQMAANPDAPPPDEGTELEKWSREVTGLFKAVMPRGTRMECNMPAGLPPVNTAQGALTQAVFNLVQNAAEAIAHTPGAVADGLIRVAAARSASRDSWVMLTVTDNGSGMTPEVAARCFDPYFSTKSRAVSTGLGLALVRGVVEAAGGNIACSSAPGRGTTFTLHLPPARFPAAPRRAGWTAVLDIDEPRAAAITAAILRSFGVDIRPGAGAIPEGRVLWITGARPLADLQAFIRAGERGAGVGPAGPPACRAIVLGAGPDLYEGPGCIIHAGERPGAGSIRAAVQKAMSFDPAAHPANSAATTPRDFVFTHQSPPNVGP